MFLFGWMKVFKIDFCEVVKKVFLYVNLNWFIMGEELKWVSLFFFNVDLDWFVIGNVVENILVYEVKFLEESSVKEIV